jgi:hypothetical protein
MRFASGRSFPRLNSHQLSAHARDWNHVAVGEDDQA